MSCASGACSHSAIPWPGCAIASRSTPATTSRTALPAGRGELRSPASGVVLGGVGCTGLPCTARLVATADAGAGWRFLAAPAVKLMSALGAARASAVSGIVFASWRDGWLYGPALWSTRNAGAHWRRLFLGGAIESMAASAGTADAVLAPPGGKPWELFSSPASRDAWARVASMTGDPSASLAVSGRAAWFVSSGFDTVGGTYLWRTADGVHWHRYPFSCPAAYFAGLVSIAAASPSHVLFLCRCSGAAGSMAKGVLSSENGGRTVHLAGQAPPGGDDGVIAVPPHRANVITLAASSAASFLDRSANGGTLPPGRTSLPLADITGGAAWKDTPAIKARLAGGFCLRAPAQGACAYANICEHCPNFRTDTGYLPVLAAQKADAAQLAEDAQARGWISEADRHRKLIARLDDLIAKAQAG
jgi:hypothetical protein